jgi:hypothetical protein
VRAVIEKSKSGSLVKALRAESWGTSVFSKTFSESDGTIAKVRDSQIQHIIGTYPYGDDHPAEIFG